MAELDASALCALDDVHLDHPRRGRVQGASLAVRPGQVVAVSGPSGAGKSLLLRGAIGLEPVQAGRVRLFGQDLARVDHDGLTALRQRLAYASLSAALLSNRTTRDNLRLPLTLRGVSRAEATRRVDAVIEALGLGAIAELRPHQFSLRLLGLSVVARALVLPAELYVLDEPSHDLDPAALAVLQREVAARRGQGAGFLLSLDDPERWRALLDVEIALPGPPGPPSGDAPGPVAPQGE